MRVAVLPLPARPVQPFVMCSRRGGWGMRMNAALAAVALVALVGGCSSDGGVEQGAGSTSSTPVTSTPGPKPSTTQSGGDGETDGQGDVTAVEPGGDYTIAGSNPNGDRYDGTLSIDTVNGLFSLSWEAGVTSEGVGVRTTDVLAASYSESGEACTAAAYQIAGDGTLEGTWGSVGGPGPGRERAVPSGSGSGLVGSYDLSGTNPDGGSYQGSMEIATSGAALAVTQEVGSDVLQGSGIQVGDVLAVGFGAEDCAIAAYAIGRDGVLDGQWGIAGADGLGAEVATPT